MQRSRECWWYRGYTECIRAAEDTGETDIEGAKAYAERVAGDLR